MMSPKIILLKHKELLAFRGGDRDGKNGGPKNEGISRDVYENKGPQFGISRDVDENKRLMGFSRDVV